MKLAYLVYAHKNYQQLERLVKKLAHADADFYIHVDKKSSGFDCNGFIDDLSPFVNVKLVPTRNDIKWGGYSSVKATLDGLKTVMTQDVKYDYIVFLSGQDYPIKSNSFIMDLFSSNNGVEFMSYCELSPTGWAAAMKRYQYFWLLDIIRARYLRFFIQLFVIAVFPKRKFPAGFTAFAGSSWWALTSDCVSYILDFVDKNREFDRFFRLTLCPDESYFQTIVMNSDFKNKVSNNDYRYIDWSDGGKSPKVLTVKDFDRLVSSDKLFARKFDACTDEKVLNMLDDHTC